MDPRCTPRTTQQSSYSLERNIQSFGLVLVARGWMVGDRAQLLFFCGMKKKMDPFAVSLLLLLVLITTPQTNVSP